MAPSGWFSTNYSKCSTVLVLKTLKSFSFKLTYTQQIFYFHCFKVDLISLSCKIGLCRTCQWNLLQECLWLSPAMHETLWRSGTILPELNWLGTSIHLEFVLWTLNRLMISAFLSTCSNEGLAREKNRPLSKVKFEAHLLWFLNSDNKIFTMYIQLELQCVLVEVAIDGCCCVYSSNESLVEDPVRPLSYSGETPRFTCIYPFTSYRTWSNTDNWLYKNWALA